VPSPKMSRWFHSGRAKKPIYEDWPDPPPKVNRARAPATSLVGVSDEEWEEARIKLAAARERQRTTSRAANRRWAQRQKAKGD
jgi:hypothetical protein